MKNYKPKSRGEIPGFLVINKYLFQINATLIIKFKIENNFKLHFLTFLVETNITDITLIILLNYLTYLSL